MYPSVKRKVPNAYSLMEKTSFGQRLRQAFGHAKYAEIAAQIGVSEPAIKKYMAGRVPDSDKLLKINEVTNCNLHWLLTGKGTQFVNGTAIPSSRLSVKLKEIAAEQSGVVFADADIGGGNLDPETYDLLVEYLLNRALHSVNLLAENEWLMGGEALRRARKFTFAQNAPQSVDERIRELVKKFSGESAVSLAKQEEFRDTIREIVQEEVSNSLEQSVYPLKVRDAEDTTRRKVG